MPAIEPRPEQLQQLLEKRPEGSLYMLNLLKFREKAVYADGRETDLSGRDAYMTYGAGVQKIIHGMGGEFVFGGTANVLLIGDGELEWDSVALVRYPSLDQFTSMVESEAYQAIHVHRDAGLDHQLLINCLDSEQVLAALKKSSA